MHFIAIMLISFMLLGVSCKGNTAPANTPADTEEFPIDPSALVTGKYEFSGRFAERAGYGEGSIKLTRQNGSHGGSYILYFANDSGILPNHEPIVSVPISGDEQTVELENGLFIPFAATKINIYISDSAEGFNPEGKTPDGTVGIPAAKRLAQEAPELTFASISDTHMNYTDYGAQAKFTAALNFFAEKGMEYVISAGDITSGGGKIDYMKYESAIEDSAFPADKIYEARGNHDCMLNNNFIKYTSGKNEVRPYDKSPYFYLLLEGADGKRSNLFIFMAQELSSVANTQNQDNFSAAQMDWVEALVKQYSGTDTNIFIVQHAVIKNFGPGDRYNGVYSQPLTFADEFTGNLRLKALLNEYKNVIMMSGHTHLSLYDLENFSDEDGTAARMIHNSSVSQPRRYSADGTISYNDHGKTTAEYGSEAYLVYVYADNIVFVGYNLSTGMIIPQASYIMEVCK